MYNDVQNPMDNPELTVSVARATLPELLDRVAAGEEVTITRHGKPVAVLVRPDMLRVRRGTEAIGAAAALRERLAASLLRPRKEARGSGAARAEALVAEIRAGRDRAFAETPAAAAGSRARNVRKTARRPAR